MKRIKNGLLIFITVVLCISLSCTGLFPAAEQTNAVQTQTEGIDGKDKNEDLKAWNKAAENNFLVLYIDSKTSNFAVYNKQSGTVWRNVPKNANDDPVAKGARKSLMKSHMQVTYADYDQDEITTINSFNASSRDGDFEIEDIKDGVKVTYQFTDEAFSIPLQYVLDGEELSVTVLTSEIKESGVSRVLSIALLPYFGAGYAGDSGYLMVPDGMGALIDFNSGGSMKYRQKVYSDNKSIFSYMNTYKTESVRLPVFGIKNGNDSVLAIITGGDADAAITAETSGTICSYNNVCAEFAVRYYDIQTYTTDRRADVYIFDEDAELADEISVRYHFMSGENTGYEEMAAVYRTFLMEKYHLTRRQQAKNEMLFDLYGAALKKKTIIAFDVDVIEPLTTYEQMVQILKQAESKGISSLRVQLSTWSDETIKNKTTTGVKINKKLGGKKGYAALNEYLKEKNIASYNSFKMINPASGLNIFSRFFDFAKAIRGSQAELYPYKLSTYEQDKSKPPTYLLGINRYEKITGAYIKALKKNRVTGVAFDDLAQMLYSDFREKRSNMTTTKAAVEKVMQSFRSQFSDTAGSTGNEYTFPYVDFITNAPYQSSFYDVESREVPFYQMVIHGLIPYAVPSVNMSSSPRQQFLKAVALGSCLSYSFIYEDASKVKNSSLEHLYSASYKNWIDTAAQQYQEMQELAELAGNLYMTGYRMHGGNVSETVYENNTRVIVNYSMQDQTIDGVLVKAENFVVVRGDR